VIGEVKRLFEIGSLTEMFLICQTRSDGIARLRGLASGPQRPELLIAEA
jgi:hypothetical protein